MRKQQYWVDDVLDRVRDSLARDRVTMQKAVGRPIMRRPNTSAILGEALLNPEGMPVQGREQLGQFLRERYGEAAAFVYPYLGLDQEGHEQYVEVNPSAIPGSTSDTG